MQLNTKPKIFSEFFSAFLKAKSSFQHFDEKDEPHSWCTSETWDRKKRGYINAEKSMPG